MYFVLIFTLLLHPYILLASHDAECIEQSINESIASISSYQRPSKNEEFRAGLEANETKFAGTFDIIIVGAGSAGCVLAERLSEDPDLKILLLEAGSQPKSATLIPAMWGLHQFDSDLNWGYFSSAQSNSCLGMRDKKCPVPRGKGPGGSSNINAMMYVRGNKQDYDIWAKMSSSQWSYKNILKYFIKSENTQCDVDEEFHGKGGLWNNEYSLPTFPLYETFVNASRDVNVSEINDYNGARQLGISKLQYNTLFGQRHSLERAFLHYGRKRRNLRVLTKALAIEILYDSTNTATGIKFVTTDSKYTATATKKVILSAGAINSPQLLMLSGIGIKSELEALGIEPKVNLPVGKFLSEHPLYTGFVVRTNFSIPNVPLSHLVQLYMQGLGPLTTVANVFSILFNKVSNKSRPDYEILLPFPGVDPLLLGTLLNYNETILTNFSSKINASTDIPLFIILLHPKSRGEVTLNSSDPLDFPIINPNMLSKEKDISILIKAIKFATNMVKSPTMKKLNATVLDPGVCNQYNKNSHEYSRCLVNTFTATLYHPSGTCSMGTNTNKSVVDPNLNVHGVKNLKVIDASIMPNTISGHLNAPTVMVAEKGADIIKQEISL